MTENAQRNREAEVNLLAAAREAQWSAAAFMGPNTMKLVSPAKVNLLLAIGAARADGYHEARTIMHALALHDTMYVAASPATADEIAAAATAARPDAAVGGPADNLLACIDLSDRTGQDLVVPAADNLVFKAADALARALGREEAQRVAVRIEKQIPAQGGLGGGSSNAAAMLVALAQLWGVSADDDRVVAVAGTATSVVAIREAMEVYDSSRVHRARVTAAELRAIERRLAAETLAERERTVGLDPKRAGVIVAGLVILEEVLALAGAEAYTASESDILHGMILEAAREE